MPSCVWPAPACVLLCKLCWCLDSVSWSACRHSFSDVFDSIPSHILRMPIFQYQVVTEGAMFGSQHGLCRDACLEGRCRLEP